MIHMPNETRLEIDGEVDQYQTRTCRRKMLSRREVVLLRELPRRD